MELYWKVTAGVLVAMILGLQLGRHDAAFQTLLAIAVCAMGSAAALKFLVPVLDLMRDLEATVLLKDGLLLILLKCTGVSLVSELAEGICQDSGNGSLGNTIRLMSRCVILYLSVPVVTALMTLIREILGGL